LLTNPLKSGKAEMESAFAGHLENGSRSHEQETLVQNMGERVGAGPVDRHRCSQSDGGNHVTHLADDVVGEKPSGIIFKNRIDNPVDGHDDTQRDEDLHSGKPPAECVYGCFRGKGAQEYGPGYRRLAVGIRKPCMKRGDGRIEDESEHDEVGRRRRRVDADCAERQISRRLPAQNDSGKQQQTAEYMDEKIAESRPRRLSPAAKPDQKNG
jgi:hypothetical protein